MASPPFRRVSAPVSPQAKFDPDKLERENDNAIANMHKSAANLRQARGCSALLPSASRSTVRARSTHLRPLTPFPPHLLTSIPHRQVTLEIHEEVEAHHRLLDQMARRPAPPPTHCTALAVWFPQPSPRVIVAASER